MMTEGDEAERWRGDDAYYYRASVDQSLSAAVVRAVAEASGRRAFDLDGSNADDALEPLYTAIDPESLDCLFRSAGDGPQAGRVEFVYSGHDVTVESDGLVVVAER